MSIHQNLRRLRAQSGMTQEQVAARLNITRQALSSYESGRTRPDIDMLLRLCQVYHTDLEGLIYDRVTAQRFTFLLRIRKWTRASWIMFVKYMFYSLWSLTVVGAVIKRYSYYLVPYIAAENPDMKARDAITLSRRMMNGMDRPMLTIHPSTALSALCGRNPPGAVTTSSTPSGMPMM